MNKNAIIFGPWCGEFCYELSWWIPEIRKQKYDNFKDCDAIAISHEGRRILYSDFSEIYISYPKELEDTLKYPATYGEHVKGKGDIIPENLKKFTKSIATEYLDRYEEITIYLPGSMPINRERVFAENPYGIYKHYEASRTITEEVKREIKFDNNRETIAIMARIRTRLGKTCYLDWNPDHWKTFIGKLVDDLKVNIVMIGIEQKEGSSAGASLTFGNSDNTKSIIFKGSDSVERQIALLKLTKCSIYGATGTAVFPFFTKTPTFTQQTVEEGFRLKYQWERDLTDNLKNIKIFDKYHNCDIYNSSPDELYEEFKKFYYTI